MLAGLAVGWVIRSRMAAPLEAERRALGSRLATLEEMRSAALRDLAVATERAEQAGRLRAALETTDQARDTAERELAALRADHAARSEAFAAQIGSLQEAREQLSAQFSE